MRFIIHDYLAHLKERDELDAILPDLLRANGFQIVKLAFRGEVEHGVDIAATKQENGEIVLYLFQVKAGDIDAQMWASGPNCVRATLDNLLDVRFEDLTQPRLKQARRHTVLVHNGHLRENIRDRFNGYIENTFNQYMSFERWNLDNLADLFYQHLLNERILPKDYQRLLKRTLVFIDVPDYNLSDFKQLIHQILPSTKTLDKPRRSRLFGLIRLILGMIHNQCQDQDFDNLSPAIVAYEYALLSIWNWMRQNDHFSEVVIEEFLRTYQQYLDVLTQWANKIAPAVSIPNGLALGGTYERVEYPLRTFQVIGNLGFLTTAWAAISNVAMTQKYLELLIKAIQNNPSRHRPLLDNHSIEIFLGMWSLLLTGHNEFAKQWLKDIFDHLVIRKQLMGRLPELYNNIDAVIEYEATGERPINYVDSSSTLIYMLFEFCLLLDSEELYLAYRPVFEDINFQVWYPSKDVEEILYSREVHEGDTEVINSLPVSFKEFRLDVQARHHSCDSIDYSPITRMFPVILLLANKHFHTPIFPFWWRNLIFSQ